MNIHECVLEFHQAVGQPTPTSPAIPHDDRIRLRLRLIAEEFLELLIASNSVMAPEYHGPRFPMLRDVLFTMIDHMPVSVDLPDFVDALTDLDYVIEGTRIELGVDGAPVLALVHRANMTKANAPRREDGKIMKPPGFVPPNILAELKRQGWSAGSAGDR